MKLLLLQDLITKIEYDFILVVIDKLIKYIYFIFYFKANIAEDLAYMFLKIMVANYNAPEEMISDRDKFFISKF
jgi:hypothetical protein